MSYSKKWIAYNILVGIALYWASNLILWFPWSISAALGITLMLSISPIMWACGIYKSLKRFQGANLFSGALITSSILLIISVIMDYVFFGIIRGAIKELYHPTTFYGYAFLFCLPIIEWAFFKKRLQENKIEVSRKDFSIFASIALISFLSIVLIIKLNIKLG